MGEVTVNAVIANLLVRDLSRRSRKEKTEAISTGIDCLGRKVQCDDERLILDFGFRFGHWTLDLGP